MKQHYNGAIPNRYGNRLCLVYDQDRQYTNVNFNESKEWISGCCQTIRVTKHRVVRISWRHQVKALLTISFMARNFYQAVLSRTVVAVGQ
ncbi:Uncharacterized protein Y057_4191 [Fusarium fujikuroi]|nr:Uncharacterized protein Y057_4191 [Fusarium fujikuroi]